MNEPKRYTHTIHDTAEGMESAFFGPHGLFAPQGEFVKYEEYERLQAEVERLTEIIRREVDGGVDLREEAQRTVDENHKLRAEVVQLTSDRDGLWESNEGNLKEAARLKAKVERLNELVNNPYRLSQGWRPIETAPKDGTWVMLATDNPDKPSGIESLDCWFPDVCQGRYCDGWMRCSEYSVNITPTHWMPLLKPPIQ